MVRENGEEIQGCMEKILKALKQWVVTKGSNWGHRIWTKYNEPRRATNLNNNIRENIFREDLF